MCHADHAVIDCVMLTSLAMEGHDTFWPFVNGFMNGLGIERIGKAREVRALDSGGIEHV